MLLGAPWPIDGSYELSFIDAIYSLLVDHPNDFYITQDEQMVFVYLHGRGLIRFIHDFTGMDDEQVNDVISSLLGGQGRYG